MWMLVNCFFFKQGLFSALNLISIIFFFTRIAVWLQIQYNKRRRYFKVFPVFECQLRMSFCEMHNFSFSSRNCVLLLLIEKLLLMIHALTHFAPFSLAVLVKYYS